MVSAEQIKALRKSRITGDDERCLSVAMQVAADEARIEHGKLAVELRALEDGTKNGRLATALGTGHTAAAPTHTGEV